jgi:hypothetical protein
MVKILSMARTFAVTRLENSIMKILLLLKLPLPHIQRPLA